MVTAALLPLPLVAWGAARAADHAGRWAGAELARAAACLPAPEATNEAVTFADGEEEACPPVEIVGAPEESAPPSREAPARGLARGVVPKAAPKPTGGIRVRAATVLKLAKRRMVPSGVPVPAEGARPAGIQLSGVSGLGVGLRDGDILTHVGGAPARSIGAVIGTATAAWSARSPAVSGLVWRNGEVLSLLVEIPYPKRRK